MSLTPKNQELITIPINRQEDSVLKNPNVSPNLQSKAEAWLKTPAVPGHEMDSVNFGQDRFELMVDTRGYNPENLKCNVGPHAIEVFAEISQSSGTAHRVMGTSRCYNLPQAIVPQQTVCCLSPEGILLIAAPWQK